MFENKKIILFGERDNIEALTLKACLMAAGAQEEDIVYTVEDCFV